MMILVEELRFRRRLACLDFVGEDRWPVVIRGVFRELDDEEPFSVVAVLEIPVRELVVDVVGELAAEGAVLELDEEALAGEGIPNVSLFDVARRRVEDDELVVLLPVIQGLLPPAVDLAAVEGVKLVPVAVGVAEGRRGHRHRRVGGPKGRRRRPDRHRRLRVDLIRPGQRKLRRTKAMEHSTTGDHHPEEKALHHQRRGNDPPQQLGHLFRPGRPLLTPSRTGPDQP
eukprot:CAMPEP_0118917634 /NCGR_PEP_ID=MMETSP1166-20130328/17440_1 /TAXON_ID=1104430 /ORGANISM="Chrysoreinhardia sp, Strain CCMP3193" /LENGTH=227 /DNA_ID=CAMNT_0006857831 /DNA_START=86 /DNA_END=766 /DNA_ORIENTATION=-